VQKWCGAAAVSEGPLGASVLTSCLQPAPAPTAKVALQKLQTLTHVQRLGGQLRAGYIRQLQISPLASVQPVEEALQQPNALCSRTEQNSLWLDVGLML
jgi:hypothetical protein